MVMNPAISGTAIPGDTTVPKSTISVITNANNNMTVLQTSNPSVLVNNNNNVISSSVNNGSSDATTVIVGNVTSSSTNRRISDNRRSNKPIMEKRRRARINNCLNELKTLILDAMKKDPARHSKLEKADILEMTVKHLQNLQRQQAVINQTTDPTVANKFKAGFSECATEVGRFPGLDNTVKRKLLQHLSNCINNNNNANDTNQDVQTTSSVQVHILPNAREASNNGILLSNGMQLLPTRLSNGDIALVLPQQQPSSNTIPLLVPILPERSPSSASSSGMSYSPSHSPEPLCNNDLSNGYNKPLSLVVRKQQFEDSSSDKPWRPW